MPRWDSFETFLNEADQAPADQRQGLVDTLLHEHPAWPWVEEGKATFIYVGMGVQRAALNLDTIKGDPPFDPMTNLDGTTLWYVTREFAHDDLLDYLLAIDDPMTPLATETDVMGRISRHWRVDPMNPTRMTTAQASVSVLRMQWEMLHLHGSVGHSGRDIFPSVIRLMAANRINTVPLITARYSLDQVPAAIDRAEKLLDVKVMVTQ